MTENNPCQILVVEDTESHVLLAQAVLQKFGIEPICVSSLDAAVAAFTSQPIDLILMDLQLPAKSGYEITYEIRRIEHEESKVHTPIVAVTAFMVGDAQERCIKAGMDACVSKPLSVQLCTDLFARFLPDKSIPSL